MDSSINGATSKAIKITTNYATNAKITKMKVLLRNRNNSATILPNEIATIKPQITKGTQKNIFGMGCITEKIVNKNLWNKNNITIVWGKGYNSSGEWVSYSGADWGGNNYKEIPLNENTAYVLSGKLVSSGYTSRFHFFDINGKFISAENKVNTGGVDAYTFTTPAKARYLSIQAYKPYYNTDTIQLEQGSTASPYIAHQEQTFIIPTQQPMRKIGDVRDFFFKNVQGSEFYDSTLTENAWYERHEIGEKIFTNDDLFGTEYSTTTRTGFYYLLEGIKPYTNANVAPPILSTKFISVSMNATWKPGNISMTNYSGTQNRVRFFIEPNKDVSDLRTILLNQPLNYELATSTNLPCTSEQTQVLEEYVKARMYKLVTHMYSENLTSTYKNVVYYKDKDCTKKNVYIINKNGIGDYTSLIDFLKDKQNDTSKKTVYIKAGEYDIFEEYGGTTFHTNSDNQTKNYHELCYFIPENTEIIGIGDVILKYLPTNLSATTEHMTYEMSPINIDKSCKISNIKLECNYCRYAFHIETGGNNENATVELKNIIAKKGDNYGYGQLLGCGGTKGTTIILKNCKFNSSRAGFSIHDRGINFNDNNITLLFENTTFLSGNEYNSIRLSCVGASAHHKVYINNCYFNNIKLSYETTNVNAKNCYDVTVTNCNDYDVFYKYENNNEYVIENYNTDVLTITNEGSGAYN